MNDLSPKPTGYSRAQIRLHWIVAMLIVLQFVLHDTIVAAWQAFEEGREFAFHPLIAQHVFGGILIFMLVIWRLVLRVRRGAPPPPEQKAPALKLLAHAVHLLTYAVMIGLCLSGMAAWFGGVGAAAEAHEIMKAVLMGLVALHVIGALYHQFWLKTNLLARMKTPQ